MKHYPIKKIIEKMKEIFPDLEYEPKVRVMEDGSIEIDITNMYEAPNLSYKKLKTVSDFFETERVGDKEFADNSAGCESCDYGSKYGLTLLIEEEK